MMKENLKENFNENGEPVTAHRQDGCLTDHHQAGDASAVVAGGEAQDVEKDDGESKDVLKMVGVKLGVRHRARLGEILDVRRRTARAQVEIWIEFEHRMIERDRMMAGVD